MTSKKLYKYFYNQTVRDRKDAKKRLKSKKWMSHASDWSKEGMQRLVVNPVSKTAKERANYLKLRAKAKGKAWGTMSYIDAPARNKYKKIVGRYP